MKVRMTKAFVVRTLKKETGMREGCWILPLHSSAPTLGELRQKEGCVGCAVGTLVCSVLPDTLKLEAVNRGWQEAYESNLPFWEIGGESDYTRLPKLLKAKAWLNCLSVVFETKGREAVIKWAEENLPPSIVVDIDGLKPKRVPPRGVTYLRK